MPLSSQTVQSLQNLTVPIEGQGNQGLLMPKLKYRFRVLLYGFGVSAETTELTKQVIDFARPSVTFEEMTIPIYNSTVYLPGKHSWEATTLNVRDDASGSVSKLVGEQLQKQLDFYEQASATAGVNYKFSMQCEILDGGNGAVEPVVLETWNLLGCYLASANYNDLNYGSSEVVTIALSIRFDNALQGVDPTTGGGVGQQLGGAVSRALGSVTGAGQTGG
jgi:hypothetical protein